MTDPCGCEESRRLREREIALLRLDQSWDTRSIIAELSEAATILLRDRGYDGHGWELISHAREAAYEWIADNCLEQAEEATVEEQEKPGHCKPGNCPACDSTRARAQREAELCFCRKAPCVCPQPEPPASETPLDTALRLGDQLADWCNRAGPALQGILDAYERRIRSDCTTPEQLAAKPWECAEFVAARRTLEEKPVAVLDVTIAKKPEPPSARQHARRRSLHVSESYRSAERLLARAGRNPEPPASEPVCKRCNDTHRVEFEGRGRRMCTRCPTPCEACRNGAYCRETPCACACHRQAEPPASELSDDSPEKFAEQIRRALRLIDRKESGVHDSAVILGFYAVSRLERYLAEEKRHAHQLHCEWRQELEAERTARAATKAELDEVIRGLCARLREVHADARKARPMPSLPAVGDAIYAAVNDEGFSRGAAWDVARFVFKLFGTQEEQDSAQVRREQLLPKRGEKVIGEATWQVFRGDESWYEDDERNRMPAPAPQPVAERYSAPAQQPLVGINDVLAVHGGAPAQQPVVKVTVEGMATDLVMAAGVAERIESLERELDCLRLRINEVADTTYSRLDKLELDGRVTRRLVLDLRHDDDAVVYRYEAEEKGE